MTEHAGPAMSQAVSVMADVDDEVISKPQVNPKAAPYKQRADLEGIARAASAIARCAFGRGSCFSLTTGNNGFIKYTGYQ